MTTQVVRPPFGNANHAQAKGHFVVPSDNHAILRFPTLGTLKAMNPKEHLVFYTQE